MYYYRVCFPEEVNPKWEDLPLPGGQNKFTGFWTPHLSCTVKIYKDRINYANFEYGCNTYSRIYRIEKEKAVVTEAEKKNKSGHKEDYDRDEVLVIRLLEDPEDVTEEIVKQERIF